MKKVAALALLMLTVFALEICFTKEKSEKTTKLLKTSTAAEKLFPRAVVPAAKPQLNFSNSDTAAEKIKTFFNDVPHLSSFKSLKDEEVHELPEPVRLAGEMLAEMRQFFVNYPQPVKVELDFYLKCSGDRELFDSVRAICAARVSQKFSEITGRKISSKLFDKRVATLKDRINL